MNNCNNCKFWQPIKYLGVAIPTRGVCGLADYADNKNTNDTKVFAIDVTADDDSNLSAELITGADFGCTLHSV